MTKRLLLACLTCLLLSGCSDSSYRRVAIPSEAIPIRALFEPAPGGAGHAFCRILVPTDEGGAIVFTETQSAARCDHLVKIAEEQQR